MFVQILIAIIIIIIIIIISISEIVLQGLQIKIFLVCTLNKRNFCVDCC